MLPVQHCWHKMLVPYCVPLAAHRDGWQVTVPVCPQKPIQGMSSPTMCPVLCVATAGQAMPQDCSPYRRCFFAEPVPHFQAAGRYFTSNSYSPEAILPASTNPRSVALHARRRPLHRTSACSARTGRTTQADVLGGTQTLRR